MTLPDLEPLTTMDERLRQVPLDRARFAAALASWEEEREIAHAAGDHERLRRALGTTGSGYRILRRWADAERDLHAARVLATCAQADAAEIRLAELDRCRDRFGAAIARLENVVMRLEATSPLRSFALQHLGKALCDAGRAGEAIPVLEEALSLRERAGDPALIASTRQALDRANDARRSGRSPA